MKHTPLTQLELVTAIRRIRVRIVERIRTEGHSPRQRGYWTEERPDEVTVAWAAHKTSDGHALDMCATLIHELIHALRQNASHKWVYRQAGLFLTDDKVRAEAAIKLLNVTYFDLVE